MSPIDDLCENTHTHTHTHTQSLRRAHMLRILLHVRKKMKFIYTKHSCKYSTHVNTNYHNSFRLLPIKMQELVNKWLTLYDDLSLHYGGGNCLNLYDERL